MNVAEIEMAKLLIASLEANGHQAAAEALKDVLIAEFAKIAEEIKG